MNTLKILLVLISIIQYIFTQKTFGDYFVCGLENPKKTEDCLKYSPNSGFNCCFVNSIPNQTNLCALVAYAAKPNIKPPKYTGPGIFDCGLSAKYIDLSQFVFLVAIFSLIL
jgi:hypothetical protein